MRNLLRVFVAAFALCFMAVLMSCGEQGGAIIITNNYHEGKTVAAYSDFKLMGGDLFSYKEKYGPVTISAESTSIITVTTDGKYGIIWREGRVDKYKTVSVSGGNTVNVEIP